MPKKIRVYELAPELNLSNKEALDSCRALGIGVKSHNSSVEDAQADRVRRRARNQGGGLNYAPSLSAAGGIAGALRTSPPARAWPDVPRPSSRAVGISPLEERAAQRWVEVSVDPRDTPVWRAAGLDPHIARKWQDARFPPQIALD
jgi:hypothetical protein